MDSISQATGSLYLDILWIVIGFLKISFGNHLNFLSISFGFLLISFRKSLVCQREIIRFSIGSIPQATGSCELDFLWIFFGFPLVLLWISFGLLGISFGIPLDFRWIPLAFLWISFGFFRISCGIPLDFLWISFGFLLDSLKIS